MEFNGNEPPKEPLSLAELVVPRLEIQEQLSLLSTAEVSTTQRMRWTQELHEAFADAVGQLGGRERATPEDVLRVMNVEGLTIYHVRRHLLKYRIASIRPELSEGNTDDEMTDSAQESPVDLKTNITTTKALRMQIKLQKKLHEQLEIQRKLQLRIEEQGKQLLQMLESRNKDTDASQALAETSQQGSKGKRQGLEGSCSVDQCTEADADESAPPMKCPRTDDSLEK